MLFKLGPHNMISTGPRRIHTVADNHNALVYRLLSVFVSARSTRTIIDFVYKHKLMLLSASFHLSPGFCPCLQATMSLQTASCLMLHCHLILRQQCQTQVSTADISRFSNSCVLAYWFLMRREQRVITRGGWMKEFRDEVSNLFSS